MKIVKIAQEIMHSNVLFVQEIDHDNNKTYFK